MWTASSAVETVCAGNFDTVQGIKLALLLFSIRPGMALNQRIVTETMCDYNYCFVGSKIGASASEEDLALKRHTRRISLAGANCAYVEFIFYMHEQNDLFNCIHTICIINENRLQCPMKGLREQNLDGHVRGKDKAMRNVSVSHFGELITGLGKK